MSPAANSPIGRHTPTAAIAVGVARPSHGFTLLELLITVILIGILAAIAIPTFNNAVDRGREAEARAVVDTILTAEAAYYQERATYTTVLTELFVTTPTMKQWRDPVVTQGAAAVTVSVNGDQTGHGHPTHIIRGILTNTGVKTITNQNGA